MRATLKQVEDILELVKQTGLELGVEGARYWSLEVGPYGTRLVERHDDDGNWTTPGTKIGHIEGRRGEVYQRLADVYRGMTIARTALSTNQK